MKLAIVSGITDYAHMRRLAACANDSRAVQSLLSAVGDYPDICFIEADATGAAAKAKIANFISAHKTDKVEELFFYFSGHGDRSEEDFFYAFSDYQADRREATGLRNSELDELIRNLAPDLTVKIVDACFSGSTYIKSAEDDLTPIARKSATANELKCVYFLFSSAENEKSLAGPKLSYFTQCLLEIFANQSGLVRYRDLIAALADEMHVRGWPSPFFVTQATGLEYFAYVGEEALLAVQNSLKLLLPPEAEDSNDSQPSSAASSQEIVPSPSPAQPPTLAMLATAKAKEAYCSKDEAIANIGQLQAVRDIGRWPSELRDAYDMRVTSVSEEEVPNAKAIGKWISNLKDDAVFATPTYDTETFTVEEYKELPTMPSSTFGALGMSSVSHFRRLLGEKEYKLEKVEKHRQVVDGFKYSAPAVVEPTHIRFSPRYPSLENYSLYIVCLFSRRTVTCLYVVEHLALTGWETTSPAMAARWKQLSSSIKDRASLDEMIDSLINEVSNFIDVDARQRLSAGSRDP